MELKLDLLPLNWKVFLRTPLILQALAVPKQKNKL